MKTYSAWKVHSWIAAPMLDGSRVTGVVVESKSGRQAIAADIVIDCTGDGDVAAGAGAPFMSPDESGHADRMQMTLMYRLGGLPSTVQGPFAGSALEDTGHALGTRGQRQRLRRKRFDSVRNRGAP